MASQITETVKLSLLEPLTKYKMRPPCSSFLLPSSLSVKQSKQQHFVTFINKGQQLNQEHIAKVTYIARTENILQTDKII